MLERLDGIERDFLDLEASMATSEVLEDQNKLREVSRKYKQMTPLVECIRKYRTAKGNADAARELIADASGAERDQLQAELSSATAMIAKLEDELKVLLLPPDPNAARTSLSKFVVPKVAKKQTCLPAICSTCIKPLLRAITGVSRCYLLICRQRVASTKL